MTFNDLIDYLVSERASHPHIAEKRVAFVTEFDGKELIPVCVEEQENQPNVFIDLDVEVEPEAE